MSLPTGPMVPETVMILPLTVVFSIAEPTGTFASPELTTLAPVPGINAWLTLPVILAPSPLKNEAIVSQ